MFMSRKPNAGTNHKTKIGNELFKSITNITFLEKQIKILFRKKLTLNLLTTTIVALPSNASKWQMGFNSVYKGVRAD